MTLPTLVLVCKRPALGIGKQRLAAKVGQELALQIAEALLACALEDVLAWPGSVVIAPADVKDREWAVNLCKQTRADAKVLPQVGGNLGQRLNALDHALRSNGLNQLVYIGSDAPDICITDYIAVDDAFLNVDTVLKPTIDGGVSIMASCKPWPNLTDLPWSTSRLGDGLCLLCQQNEHAVGKLPVGFDVDEFEDLSHLVVKLAQDQRPARRALLALARQIIQQKISKQKVIMPSEGHDGHL
jgi:glycosyltransferase A (GT-A) superfamily protein (DUF2064 family)